MRYYTNAFGWLFGGKAIKAIPDIQDVAGIPEIRIRILRAIAESDRTLSKFIDIDPNNAIKADKIADYQERMLKANGYYGTEPDFAEMRQIHEDMEQDWWIQKV